MMKKILLFTAILSFLSLQNLNAQCTPTPFPPPNLTNPDTTAGIPPAYANVPYSFIVNVRVPADTLIFGTPLPIDSIGLDSVKGLPPTFSYVTNSPSNYWKGGTYGCFEVTGNPTMADTGVYRMTMHTKIYVGHNPNNSILYEVVYDFEILDSNEIGFEDIQKDQFAVRQNAPNPFDNNTIIRFNSPQKDEFSFHVFDVAGKLVRQKIIMATQGINQITFNRGDLPSGIYIYQLSNDKYNIHKRMVIR